MTKKNPEKTAARKLQSEFGASYETCLNLVRAHGETTARTILAEYAKKEKKSPH